MKRSCVFLLLGLILIMALCSDANLPEHHSVSCCFKFFRGKIPPQNIVKVKKTDSPCTMSGFIVTTTRFHSLCVREDPRKNHRL
ncbi:C-C motif chemokine 14-like [Neoarius graeffei]|uniref:C-C motif chemokine 14-like n=1 Tax=Neoarius graeffei TaxID=443677 RepID=UPI00298C95BF|nr:C-C motif chemokine 14-like [Neoarius graeffei]